MILYSRWNCEQSSLRAAYPRGAIKASWTTEEQRRWKDNRRMNNRRFSDDGWRDRLNLFETYTYPSVLSQTDQNFRWLGLVHKDSPAWFIESLRKFYRMEIQLVDYDTEAEFEGGISVNLDTDDAISRNFVQNAKQAEAGEIIYVHGLKHRVRDDFWFETDDEIAGSAFNVINHPSNTVLDYMHGRSDLDKHLIHNADPMWLQVIHGRNIANGFQPNNHPGGRTHLDRVQRHFELRMDNALNRKEN